jgi:hypothetical protein
MHSVPVDEKAKEEDKLWTYRWREWLPITEEEYQKEFTDKKKRPPKKLINGRLHYQKYKKAKAGKDIPYYFRNKPDADAEMFRFEAKLDARLRERQKRESWHDKFYNFGTLIQIYEKERKISAKNSWDSKLFWFRDYVLHFFLTEKMCANLEEWKGHFFEFKKFLEVVKTKRSNKALAYASKNHCINELNYFLQVMWEANKCEKQPKLPLFSEKLVNNHKGAKDLIPKEEFEAVYNQIVEFEKTSIPGRNYFSDTYWCLRHTGLRINEILGIGIYNFRQGPPPRQEVKDLLANNNITHIYSYLFLLHQPAQKRRNGTVIEFKPLKGKSGLPQDARYIPILDSTTHNILRKYHNQMLELKKAGQYGNDEKNYAFFFDHVSAQQMRQYIYESYVILGIKDKYKSTHYTRHSKTTDIVKTSKGMSDELARLVVGHAKGSKTTQRYNLLYQEIVEEEMRNSNRDAVIEDAFIIDEKTKWVEENKRPYGMPDFGSALKKKA